MADPNNPGQFGNRSDTKKQARKGGKATGASNLTDADRARGGRNSGNNSNNQ